MVATSAARVSSTFEEIAHRCAGLAQHAREVGHDVGELRLEAIRQRTLRVEAGNAGDNDEIADPGAERQRRGFDVGWGGDVVDGHLISLS